MQASFESYRETPNENYEKIVDIPRFEVCKMIEGMAGIPFLNTAIDFARSFQGNLLDICNTIGDIKVFNVSFAKSPTLALFPSGNFKSMWKFYDDIDDNIMNFTYYSVLFR